MPKEVILGEQARYNPDVPRDQPFVEISWGREAGYVQLATREGGDVDESVRAREGWFASLDRQSINQMIRTLRRARDAAFGADA